MDMLSNCYVSVLWGMYHVWQGLITTHTTRRPQTTPQICSAVMLGFVTRSFLNHGPHQWCSGQMMMIHVCTCYPTHLWVLYEACTMSVRGGSTDIPPYDPQLHPDMLSCYPGYWNQERESCTWCSGTRMMTQVLIWYPTILWVLYES